MRQPPSLLFVSFALCALCTGPALAQPATFNLSAQKNVSAREFIQDLASQAGLSIVFLERGQGRPTTQPSAEGDSSESSAGSIYTGNNVINTSSTTPGLASASGTSRRAEIPLPSQFNFSFGNLQGGDAYAQLREVLELMGLRAFRSRVNRNLIYVSDRLSNPTQVAIRLRVLLINDNVARERGISLGSGLTTGAYDSQGNPVVFGRFGADLGAGGAFLGGAYPAYSGLVGSESGSETGTTGNIANYGVGPNRSTLTFSVGSIVLQLQLLEQVRALQTLLDQQIIVSDGETATLSQNVQFRLPQTIVSNGAALNGSQAINARTTLNVTPVVLPSKKQVNISIRGDFSDPQGSGQDLVINTNSIDVPNLRLDSGGMALLGGMTRHDEADTEHRVPLLSSIPLIGELFRSRSKSVRDQRLLIMIEPVIQDQPTGGAELLPTPPSVSESPNNLPPEMVEAHPRAEVQPPTTPQSAKSPVLLPPATTGPVALPPPGTTAPITPLE